MRLGITTIQRDRAPWIKERVAFHYLVGFRKFYIFLNHYVCPSRSFFLNFKNKVRTPDGGGVRNESYWEEPDRNEVLDNSMDRFIELLKNILNSP